MASSVVQTLRDLVDERAAAQPAAACLIAAESDAVTTYAALREASLSIAAFLDDVRIPPGEPVAFMMPNGLSAATLFIGIMAAGRVVAPQNLLAQDSYLEHALTHSGTRLVFADASSAARLQGIVGRKALAVRVHAVELDALGLGAARASMPAPLHAHDPALLMYTSGTTGQPKGALLSHANLLAAARAVAGSLDLGPSDRVLSSLPLYHVNGQVIATLAPLVAGGSIVCSGVSNSPKGRLCAPGMWPLRRPERGSATRA